ncbi:uncharacterized protein LY89DRAFT_676741 [Mollisia scopiformis]|uniref:SprT-like domain-containing protein n=1 Tax=Mollisia scopiformis TaxID=149040 RepID=A0A132B8W8_MOLSC|nr:uncharacterized protein LY89DRAFT_676741 [Mollisia scopiformis]KUJ08848.1 hypothetical protein LY89DRAFT_676741 [Mollisia scopiformis]
MAEMYDHTIHSRNTFHNGLPTPDSELENNKHRRPSLYATPVPHSNIAMLCHTPDELVQAIQQFTKQDDTVIPGLEAMQEHYSLAFQNQQNDHRCPAEDLDQLSFYFNIFDRLFFFSSLQNLCAIRLKSIEGHHAGQLDSHRSNWRTEVPPTHACLITISDLTTTKPPLPYQKRMKKYLGTLLHEMLHAYFEVYGCMCTEVCTWRYNTLVGIHGSSWQDAALAIENATCRLVGERIDLGRVDSLAMNWIAAKSMPVEGTLDLASWGMTYAEVRTAYDYYVELYHK